MQRLKPTGESLVLLILDSHTSDKNVELLYLSGQNYVHLLSVASHSGHKIHALDKSFRGPLKNMFLMRNDLGSEITHD